MPRNCSVRLSKWLIALLLSLSACHSFAQVTILDDPKKPRITMTGAALGIDHSPMAAQSAYLGGQYKSFETFSDAQKKVMLDNFKDMTLSSVDIEIKKLIEHNRTNMIASKYATQLIGGKEQLYRDVLGISDKRLYESLDKSLKTFRSNADLAADILIILAYLEYEFPGRIDDNAIKKLEELVGIGLNDMKHLSSSFSDPGEKSITLQSVASDKSNTIWGGELSYSTRYGIGGMPNDIAVNRIESGAGPSGFGATLRLGYSEMSGNEGRLYYLLRSSVRSYVNYQAGPQKPTATSGYRRGRIANMLTALLAGYAYLSEFQKKAVGLYQTASFRYQHVNGDSDVYTAGVDMSLLRPICTCANNSGENSGPPAFLYRLTVQGVSRAARSVSPVASASGVRVGFGMFFQDSSPYLTEIESKVYGKVSVPHTGKWSHQVGVSVFLQNSVDPDTTVTGTYKFRFLPHKDDDDKKLTRTNLSDYVHVPIFSLGVGSGLRGKPFILGSVSVPF